MNGKKAKFLRKKIREATKGTLPEVNYAVHRLTGQIILGNCQRRAYQIVKKKYKNGMVSLAG